MSDWHEPTSLLTEEPVLTLELEREDLWYAVLVGTNVMHDYRHVCLFNLLQSSTLLLSGHYSSSS